jgi:lactoylglutathione lyase
MIRQLAHVCFFTDKMDEMKDFYANKLGLKVKFTLNNKKNEVFGYYFECGHSTFLEIFDQSMAIMEWGGEKGNLETRAHYQHLCFEVTGLESVCKKLASQGISVSEIAMGLDFSRQAWIRDPDGNAIELMEYTADSLQLKGM